MEPFGVPDRGAVAVAVTTTCTTPFTTVVATAGMIQSSLHTSIGSSLQNGAGYPSMAGASTHVRFSSQDPRATTRPSVSLPALYPPSSGRVQTTQPLQHQVSSATNSYTHSAQPVNCAIPQHNLVLSMNQPMMPSATHGLVFNPQSSGVMTQSNHQTLNHSMPMSNVLMPQTYSFTGQSQVHPEAAELLQQGIHHRPQQTPFVDYSGGRPGPVQGANDMMGGANFLTTLHSLRGSDGVNQQAIQGRLQQVQQEAFQVPHGESITIYSCQYGELSYSSSSEHLRL